MRALVIIGVGVAALASPTSAIAGDFRSACNTASLCSGVEPGGGRIIKCLKEHKSQVSTKCKTALGEFFLNQPIRGQKRGGGAGAGGGGDGAPGGGAGGGEQGPPPAGGGEAPPEK